MNIKLVQGELFATVEIPVKGFITRRESWQGSNGDDVTCTEYIILAKIGEVYVVFSEAWGGIQTIRTSELTHEYEVKLLEKPK